MDRSRVISLVNPYGSQRCSHGVSKQYSFTATYSLNITHSLTYLLLEISNGIVIGVSEEVSHLSVLRDVVLEMVHQMRTITLNLFRRCNSAEDNLGEFPVVERSVRDASQHYEWCLDNRHTIVISECAR